MTEAPKPTENAGLSAIAAIPHSITAHRIRSGVFLGTIDPLQSYITGEAALQYGERVRLATIADLRAVPQPPQEPTPEAVERAAVRVKPLEWGGRNGYFKGEGADGSRYDVCEIGPGNWLCDKRSGGRSKILGARDSMEASQALAQADFEARILSALTAPA